jgi:hypothetical protein
MGRTIAVEVPAGDADSVQTEIRHHFEEMDRAYERMRKGQFEIGRLKKKTRAMLTGLMMGSSRGGIQSAI